MAKLNTKIVMLEGEQGKDGTNIKSVEKSASDGLTDTYTITLTDGSNYYKEQTIQNNKSILMLGNNKQCVNNNIYNKRRELFY